MSMRNRMETGAIFLIALVAACGTHSAAAATLAAGDEQTCAIDRYDSRVHCWGRGQLGQLGDGYLVARAAPAPVAGVATAARAVVSGGQHSCELSPAGGVRCWGANESGQLGDGTVLYRAEPTPVPGLASGVTALALGLRHSCALLQGGGIKCWGESDDGRLGTGHSSDQTQPNDVLGLSGASAIDAGFAHSCALVAGAVKCWGYNGYGQLGDSSWTTRTLPVDVPTLGFTATVLAVGGYHTCARSATGALRCWGRNSNGELGDGTSTNRNAPVNVDGLASGVSLVTAGGYHTCALAAGAQLKCWGYNYYGQLGDGTRTNAARPQNVGNAGAPVVEVSAGDEHTCARGSGNTIRCWGNAYGGRTGVGDTQSTLLADWSQPQMISGLSTPLKVLSLFSDTSCGVTLEGAGMCWGSNYYGQVGDGALDANGYGIDQTGPREVHGLAAGVRDITAGELHACAVKSDGTVWCWGDNEYGQLADGTTIKRITPVQVPGITDAAAIASGGSHTCVLSTSGGVRCWGRNNYGQLGDGSLLDRDEPVAAVGLSSGVIALELGYMHGCALLQSGGLRCWGRNQYGQIGDGSTVDRYLPTAVNDSGTAYARVSAGAYHTCGRTSGGQAKCWGYNGNGQIGNGTTTSRTLPTAVDGLASGVTDIAAGSDHSCALRGAAEMKCWGENNYYQLGDGSTTRRLLPVSVINLGSGLRALSLGTYASCVRLADGKGKCWGRGNRGQLGNGSTNYSWIGPVEIAQWRRSDGIFADGFQ